MVDNEFKNNISKDEGKRVSILDRIADWTQCVQKVLIYLVALSRTFDRTQLFSLSILFNSDFCW